MYHLCRSVQFNRGFLYLCSTSQRFNQSYMHGVLQGSVTGQILSILTVELFDSMLRTALTVIPMHARGIDVQKQCSFDVVTQLAETRLQRVFKRPMTTNGPRMQCCLSVCPSFFICVLCLRWIVFFCRAMLFAFESTDSESNNSTSGKYTGNVNSTSDICRSPLSLFCHSVTRRRQTLFSERELKFMFAICRRPSVCRLSSVCNVRAPYSGD